MRRRGKMKTRGRRNVAVATDGDTVTKSSARGCGARVRGPRQDIPGVPHFLFKSDTSLFKVTFLFLSPPWGNEQISLFLPSVRNLKVATSEICILKLQAPSTNTLFEWNSKKHSYGAKLQVGSRHQVEIGCWKGSCSGCRFFLFSSTMINPPCHTCTGTFLFYILASPDFCWPGEKQQCCLWATTLPTGVSAWFMGQGSGVAPVFIRHSRSL